LPNEKKAYKEEKDGRKMSVHKKSRDFKRLHIGKSKRRRHWMRREDRRNKGDRKRRWWQESKRTIKITRRRGKSIFGGFWAGLIWFGVWHKLFLFSLGDFNKVFITVLRNSSTFHHSGWPKNIILIYTLHRYIWPLYIVRESQKLRVLRWPYD
jgi:hypothetical protein